MAAEGVSDGPKEAAQSKLDRWLQRSSASKSPPAPTPSVAAASTPPAAGQSKLDRWLKRSEASNSTAGASSGGKEAASQHRTSVELLQKQSTPSPAVQSTSQASTVSSAPHDPSKSPITSTGPAGPVTPRTELASNAPLANTDEGPPQATWERYVYVGGEFEGFFRQNSPHGFGRNIWDSGMAYHGNWVDGEMDGEGKFIFGNGDTYEGSFKAHKPNGWGIWTTKATGERKRVRYDGTKKFSEDARPVESADPGPNTIDAPSKVMLTAVAKGQKADPPHVGDFSHCKGKTLEGVRLVHTVPLRAHRPLDNAPELRGKIAVCQRGYCSFSKKIRFCQEAGAAGVVIVGTDNNLKYNQVFRVHEGDPRDDDVWPDDAVPAPIKVEVPVCYCLGRQEAQVRDGAIVSIAFLPNSPSPIWLLGCLATNKQTIFPELRTKADRDALFAEFLRMREEERSSEQAQRWLEKREEGQRRGEEGGSGGATSGLAELLRGAGLRAEQLAVLDAWLAGQSGAMSFSAAQPTFRLSTLEAQQRREGGGEEGGEAMRERRGGGGKGEKASFEMGAGEALWHWLTRNVQ